MTVSGKYPSQLVFWLTYVLIVVGTTLFVYSSFEGVMRILDSIKQENSSKTAQLLEDLIENGTENFELMVWAALEFDVLENQQNISDALIETQTWIRFMNSSFGSILIMCGAIFILSRIRIDKSELKAENSHFMVILGSSSPGLFMLIVGSVLVNSPLYATQKIKVDDGGAYPAPYNDIFLDAVLNQSGQPLADELQNEYRKIMCESAKKDGEEDSEYCEK